MQVCKRGNRGYETIQFDKITKRIQQQSNDLTSVDAILIAQRTISAIVPNMKTSDIDAISASIAEELKLDNPNYGILAGRLLISNLHKSTPNKFTTTMRLLYQNGRVSDSAYAFITAHAIELDAIITDSRDYLFDYFAVKTLQQAYLQKIKLNGIDTIVDRPQYIYMRIAVALHYRATKNSIKKIHKCYTLMSRQYYTHATPTLYNACSRNQQLASCFLMSTGDSIEQMHKTMYNFAKISASAGGVGTSMSCIRPVGATINSTGGRASGLAPQLKIYNEESRTFNQGGRRPGAHAIYIEPWHGDIQAFLRLKKQHGAETERARDLFYALWINDLFIQRVKQNAEWSLFNAKTAPGLIELYDGMMVCKTCNYCSNPSYNTYCGTVLPISDCRHEFVLTDAFTQLYCRYELENRAIEKIPARDILLLICDIQRESGTPYICFKDTVNRQSAHANIGTIKNSNLCAEIMQYSDVDSCATCILSSINLKQFVTDKLEYDMDKLHQVVEQVAKYLDLLIDVNDYPITEAINNSRDYRAIGIGVQGLANVYTKMQIPFLSAAAEALDIEIAETIYHAALTASVRRAKKYGAYARFNDSPASQGRLQYKLREENACYNKTTVKTIFSGKYNWHQLEQDIMKYGLRNSLSVAYMPTVSTSQILGNNESFEPFDSNIFTKLTQAGKFTLCNTDMIRHLSSIGLWNQNIQYSIVNNEGSIQHIDAIPDHIKQIYKTVWELPQKQLMYRADLRGAFIDQSQSLNIHLRDNSTSTIASVMICGWNYGLKTGSYYIRTKPAATAVKTNTIIKPETVVEVLEECRPGCDTCSG